jgi:translation initiation factor IF-2
MNNGKVRIYELSKELNLDNKDILAVCEQLNISVKSHSSTITDSEAEQIRAAAEKYTASHLSKPVIRQGVHQSGMEQKTRVTAPVQKKQQIVAIKSVPRSTAVDAPIPPSYSSNQADTDQAVQAPVRPAASSNRPANRPSISDSTTELAVANSVVDDLTPDSLTIPGNQPTPEAAMVSAEPTEAPTEGVAGSVASEPAVAEGAVAESAASERASIAQPPPTSSKVAPQDQPSQVSRPPARPSPSPELTSPPPRAADSKATPKPSSPNKPILKRTRVEQGIPEQAANGAPRVGDANGQGSKSPARPVGASAKPTLPRQPGSRSPEKPTPRPQQTIVELRRPKPVRSDGDASSQEPRGGAVGDLERPELKINRPRQRTPEEAAAVTVPGDVQVLQPKPPLPRSLKKGKEWEDEEEGREGAKVAKVGTKTKRRAQPNLDEEDADLDLLDLDEDGDGADAPAQISLSLVRPPKPKSSRQAPTKAAPAIAIPKRKTSGTRDRRERREEIKVEKPTQITLTGSLTVQELAALMMIADTEIIRTLFMKGIMATVTQTLDIETATMVAQELGVEVETSEKESQARKLTEMLDVEDLENLHRRPPVVTIMGHVDHGKTSLLDSIRKTKVAQGEAGGITQHIGAYHVDVEHNGQMQQVVFLDTPGHEAFTAMRARGARVTDIAILVVAADDGVQPQTVEAISHAKAAEVPIVVAINKIDKEGAQPERVKQELTEYQLVPEEWGGETIMVPVSAISGENLDTLLEMILLVSEVGELSANPDRPAKGTVIEAHLDKAKGPTATLLVQNGTLHVGNVLVAGSVLGKVRAMVDDRGQRVKAAGPSFAVEVLGLSDVPAAGDEFLVFQDEKEARAVADDRTDEQRQSRLLAAMSSRRVSLNTLSARAQEGELKELNLVLKADVQGSVEAILGSFKQLPQNEVQVRVLYAAPGEISETDIDLAAASSAVIIGFNTTLAPGARQAADRLGVDVRDYNIIYKLLDDIQAAMEGLLEPELVEEPLGEVEVRAVFPVGRGQVAGCYVKSGKIIRNCKIRILRKGEVIHSSNLDSLKRMKEDAKEVNTGFECGIGVDDFNSWEIGDMISAYRMITKRRTLSK